MSIDIVVPTLGESVSEATIARWKKQAANDVSKAGQYWRGGTKEQRA